jgi:putative FmdB family regulatory protein
MPIYEFYCEKCHTIFNFFSSRIDTKKVPSCPSCGLERLERQVSLFSVTGRAQEDGDSDLGLDDAKMEKAMEWMARQSESINDDDPRQAARLMREFSERTGVELGAGMQDALARMAAGEDPEQIEAEMNDVLEGEEPFVLPDRKGGTGSRRRPAARDDTLYEL